MELTRELVDKIEKTHDTVLELKVVIVGKNSDKGLVGQVNDTAKKVDDNTKKIHTDRIILAAILGSGLIGGGVAGLLQLLS